VNTFIGCLYLVISVAVQSNPQRCDSSIVTDRRDPWAYRARGINCEGRFVAPRSGPNLRIVGFFRGDPRVTTVGGRTIQVSWDAPPSMITLRAVSLPWRVFYRMDATVTSGTKVFYWPSRVVEALHLQINDLGILAANESEQSPVLIPVSVTDSGVVNGAKSISLVALSNREFNDVRLLISSSIPNSGLASNISIAQSGVMPRVPFRIVFPSLRRGLYRIVLVGNGAQPSSIETTVFIP